MSEARRERRRAERHTRKIEKKRRLEDVVNEMHDEVVYSFSDGPIKDLPLKGKTWKKLIWDSKNAKATEPEV